MFKGERGFVFSAMAGAVYHHLLSLDLLGAEVEVAFGSQTRVGAFGGRLSFELGSSIGGLTSAGFGISPFWEGQVGAARLGVGGKMSLWGIIRATTGYWVPLLGGGPRLHLHWDFKKGEHVSGFLGVRAGLIFYEADVVAFVPDIGLGLGVRAF